MCHSLCSKCRKAAEDVTPRRGHALELQSSLEANGAQPSRGAFWKAMLDDPQHLRFERRELRNSFPGSHPPIDWDCPTRVMGFKKKLVVEDSIWEGSLINAWKLFTTAGAEIQEGPAAPDTEPFWYLWHTWLQILGGCFCSLSRDQVTIKKGLGLFYCARGKTVFQFYHCWKI